MTIIIERRKPERLCALCVHAYLGPYGVYCLEYRELIGNEEIAKECPEWRKNR